MRATAVIGTLKGYDALMNLVLDEVKETMRGKSHSSFEGYADYSGRDEYQATALGCWRTRAHKPPYPLTSALRGKGKMHSWLTLSTCQPPIHRRRRKRV